MLSGAQFSSELSSIGLCFNTVVFGVVGQVIERKVRDPRLNRIDYLKGTG